MRPLQLFSDEYLARCRELSPDTIARFLEDFRRVHGGRIYGQHSSTDTLAPANPPNTQPLRSRTSTPTRPSLARRT